MTAVVNTSPLVVLTKVRRLDLLPALYGDIVIPQAVVDEMLAKRELVTPELQRFVDRGRARAAENRTLFRTLTLDLGPGEAEVMALAAEMMASRTVGGFDMTPEESEPSAPPARIDASSGWPRRRREAQRRGRGSCDALVHGTEVWQVRGRNQVRGPTRERWRTRGTVRVRSTRRRSAVT
jgi:hypothetical protein